jgi:hypothetical protein
LKGNYSKSAALAAEISEPKSVVLEDLEARAQGFVNNTKSLFFMQKNGKDLFLEYQPVEIYLFIGSYLPLIDGDRGCTKFDF